MALLRSYEDLRATLAKRSLFKIFRVHLMKSCHNMIKSHLLCNSPLLFIDSRKHKGLQNRHFDLG